MAATIPCDKGMMGHMSASLDLLHNEARRAIAAGETKFRDAAELLAKAAEFGATQRQSAKAVGRSQRWVNALLQWRKNGYRGAPFEKCKRFPRDTPAIQNRTTRRLMTAEQTIPDSARQLLIKALRTLASERTAERASAALIVENQRARLNLTWDELIVRAEAESRLNEAA
jgi:hypothetical protein